MSRHKIFLSIAALMLALVLTGCSLSLGSLLPGDDIDGDPVDPTPSTDEMTVRVYFPDRHAQYVIAEEREVIVQTTLEEAALRALLEGPEAPYLSRAFPENTEVISLEIIDGIAYVNFKEGTHVPGSAGESAAIRSLVLTLTDMDSVDQVQILIDGRTNVSLGGHFELNEPMSRDEVYDANLVPDIVAGSNHIKVFWPAPETAVSGSFEIWGIAEVFEAHVAYDMVVDGEVVLEGYTTAMDADWGSFFHTVTLPDGVTGDAILRIYSPDQSSGESDLAVDGRLHTVEIPLTVEEPTVVAESEQIKLYAPAPGSTVRGSFEIWGIAQVYESTVSYDLTVDGQVVAAGFTTAWAFDWGTFRHTVEIPSDVWGDGTLRLYSESAEDGSAMFAVEVPLTIE